MKELIPILMLVLGGCVPSANKPADSGYTSDAHVPSEPGGDDTTPPDDDTTSPDDDTTPPDDDTTPPDDDPPDEVDDTAAPDDDAPDEVDDTAAPDDDPPDGEDDTAAPDDDPPDGEDDTAAPDDGPDLVDDTAEPHDSGLDDTGLSDTGTAFVDTGPSTDPPVPPLEAPIVYGEDSAGHSTPTWIWTWTHEAEALEWRIDDGPWWTGDPASDRLVAPEPLAPGEHTIFVTVTDASGVWSEPGSFTTRIEYFERDGYWNGVERVFAQSPLGHHMGVVCHNCYEEDESSPAANLEETMAILDGANAEEADLLEFDVRYYDGEWRLEHDDWSGSDAAFFEDILAYEALLSWDQPLFIEIKERDPTPAAAQELLQMVLDAGFATNGRPVFFRAFQDVRIDNLVYLQDSLETGAFPLHEHYIRLHVIMNDDTAGDTSGFQDLLESAVDAGFHGVNFNWHTPDLFNLLEYAKSLGLGTSMWTIPASMGEAWCASMREDIDALVVDYDLSDCRQVVEEETTLLYLNASELGSDLDLEWYGEDGEPFTHTIGADTDPAPLIRVFGEGLHGTSLWFDSSFDTSLGLYDADNDPAAGFLLATTVEFHDLDLGYGETRAIFSKADSGGFALELHGGFLGTILRFGVHIDGEYRYAERNMLGVDIEHSHFIMGAYDGNGRVRLWLNNSDAWVDESGVYSEGVTLNDSPITLGADPEGAFDTRFHFDGRIQMAMLQRWRDH